MHLFSNVHILGLFSIVQVKNNLLSLKNSGKVEVEKFN